METARYTSYTKKAIKNAISHTVPRPEILECHPSPFCQLSCSYCHSKWIGINEQSVHSKKHENWKTNLLTVDQYADLFKDFKKMGGKFIIISGGEEPALYPDFLDLLEICNKIDYMPHVYTNGISNIIIENIYIILQMVSSIRISIHISAGYINIMNIIEYLKKVVSVDKKLLDKVHIAIYEDIFELGEKKAIQVLEGFSDVALNIEIKNIIYNSEDNNCICKENMDKVYNILKAFGASNVWVKNTNLGISNKCFALHRSTVVDPYGGVHICCMRAHLSEEDFAYLGNIKSQSLQRILDECNFFEINKKISNCKVCSARDYKFNKLIEEFLETNPL